MEIVLPGEELVRASSLPLVIFSAPEHSMLIREDFPTLERPMKAISGSLLPGLPFKVVLLPANAAFLIFIPGMFGCKFKKIDSHCKEKDRCNGIGLFIYQL